MITDSHPVPIKGIGIPSSQGQCPIDLGEQEIDPCYHLEAWLGKPFPLILVASDLTFCFSQQTVQRITWTMSQPPWPWYTLEAPGAVLTALLSKLSLQNWVLSLSFGKGQAVLIQLRRSSSFFCACVVFPLSCKLQKGISRALPDLWKTVKLRGLLMHGSCRNHSFALAAIRLPYHCWYRWPHCSCLWRSWPNPKVEKSGCQINLEELPHNS